MKVLWLSPWMRPLARIYCESLMNVGVETMLVTSDRHPSSGVARPYELVLDTRVKQLNSWAAFAKVLPLVRGFCPDVMVAELVRDPRWMALAPRVPRFEMVHDDKPHDAIHARPAWEQAIFSRWSRSASKIAFSKYVAEAIGAEAIIPLTSDLEQSGVPALVESSRRRDFVVVGRMHEYKNLDICMEAWRMHTEGDAWRGDRLILIGDGDWNGALPENAEWRRARFQYWEVLDDISHAKASVVHYRQPSQSGVQVLSMQLGVTPIVSTAGALPEMQPPAEQPVGIDDIYGLARRFDELADPVLAAERGAVCRAHYEKRYSADAAASVLQSVLASALQRK
mgnify:CR=1 FL=1